MKVFKNLLWSVLAFSVWGLTSCTNDDIAVKYSVNSLKNTELMTVLKAKGYQFDKDGKLILNELAQSTTSLDLSGTKLKDLSGLDIFPRLKEVKLSNNGYGPSFDFSKLPAQITGVDLTGNEIYNYENLVDVKVEENGDETVKNLHNITKLYLPVEAKYNIKDLVRFYRQNKDNIASGKIDMKMVDDKGNVQKYNTIRTIGSEEEWKVIKDNFSSIIADSSKADELKLIDLNKRLNSEDQGNDFSLIYEGKPSTTFVDAMCYIIANPSWEGEEFILFNDSVKLSVPYLDFDTTMTAMRFGNVNVSKGICWNSAKNLRIVRFGKVDGLSEIDLSHSQTFGQLDLETEGDPFSGSMVALFDCPDLASVKYPNKNGFRSYWLEFSVLPKLKNLDLSQFQNFSSLVITGLNDNCKIVYPEIKEFPTLDNKSGFACNDAIFMRDETLNFLRKYALRAKTEPRVCELTFSQFNELDEFIPGKHVPSKYDSYRVIDWYSKKYQEILRKK